MAEINNVIAEASQDLQTIEDFVNLPAGSDVRPRLLPSVNVGTLAGTRDAIFEAGGLPAEPFETKAQMETDGASLPDGQLAMVHNETTNNGLYIKTAGAWVKSKYNLLSADSDEAMLLMRHHLDKAIIGEGGLIQSINLYDDNAAKQTGGYIGNAGEIVEGPTHYVTGFIPVIPTTAYSVSQIKAQSNYISSVSFYDKDKQFISRINTTATLRDTGYQGLTTPKGAYYVRLNCQNGNDAVAKRMFYKGSEQLPYEPYRAKKINPDAIDSTLFDAGYLLDKLTPSKLALRQAIIDTLKDEIVGSNLLNSSYNLYDDNTDKTVGAINADGTWADNPMQFVTDFIPVDPSSDYTAYQALTSQTYIHAVVFYDVNRAFISREVVASNIKANNYAKVTTPANCAYARLYCQDGNDANVKRMFYKGSDPLPYQKFAPKSIKKEALDPDIFKPENLINTSTRKQLLTVLANDILGSELIDTTVNLYNDNATKISGGISPDGEYVENTEQYLTDFIPVDPDSNYTASQVVSSQTYFHAVAYFNKNKEFIRRDSIGSIVKVDGYHTVTTPTDAAYVQLYFQKGSDAVVKRMFYKGSEQIPYESFKPRKIKWEALPEFSKTSEARRGDRIAFTGDRYSAVLLDFPDSYSKDDERNIAEGRPGQVTYDDMVTWWGDLVDEFPDYITKEVIGHDASGQYALHSYRFSPDGIKEREGEIPTDIGRPRVMLIAQHIEQMNQLYPVIAMREMCRKWQEDPALTALRHEVEFLVIPYVHPYGFGRDYRVNADGISGQVDFPYKWTKSERNGDAPWAAVELQHVKAATEQFKPHVFLDMHSAFAAVDDRTGMWVDANLDHQYSLTSRASVTSFYPKFKAKFPYADTIDKHLLVTYTHGPGQAQGYAYAIGAVGGLVEMMKNYNYRPAADGLYNDGLIFSSSMLLNLVINCIAQYRDYGYPNPHPLYNGEGVYDPENGIGI